MMKQIIWILIFSISTSVLGNDFENFFFKFYDSLVIFKSEYYDLEQRKIGVLSGRYTAMLLDDGKLLIHTSRVILPDINKESKGEAKWTKASNSYYIVEFSNSTGENGSGELFLLPNNQFRMELVFNNGSKSISSGTVEDNRRVLTASFFVSRK